MKLREEQVFGIARKVVANMTGESFRTIAHSVVSYEADVTKLMPVIKELNEGASKEERLSVNTVMLGIMCEAIKAAPIINSHLEFNSRLVRGKLKVYDTINVSMPTILPSGEMMTINVRNLEDKSLTEMGEAINDIMRKVKNTDFNEALYNVSLHDTLEGLKHGKVLQALRRLYGSKMPGEHRVKLLKGEAKEKYYAIPESDRLSQKELEQGTITISNLGSIYREGTNRCYLLEIVPPQTCVIALLSIRKEAVVVTDENGEDRIEIRQILPMTIAFDHRAYDYCVFIPMLRRLDEIFSDPSIIKDWK